MAPYEQLLECARSQFAAASRGDLDSAARLFDQRAVILAQAPPPGSGDADLVRQILRIDRELAALFRARMLWIREQATAAQQARAALNGYHSSRPRMALLLETSG